MSTIASLMLHYSYLILFGGVVVEGEIFPLTAGWLVAEGDMHLGWTLIVTFVGVVIGDMLWFAAARAWGRPLLNRYGRVLWIKPERLEALERHFTNHGKKTLAITKFVYSFGHSSIVVAGIALMRWSEFIKVDIPASLAWSVVFVGMGYTFGQASYLVGAGVHRVAISLAIAVGVIWYLRGRLVKKLSNEPST